VIKLRGTAAKEGEDEATKAATLMVIPLPLGLLVHGKDAEIQPGLRVRHCLLLRSKVHGLCGHEHHAACELDHLVSRASSYWLAAGQ
jgi:hypothetical protein